MRRFLQVTRPTRLACAAMVAVAVGPGLSGAAAQQTGGAYITQATSPETVLPRSTSPDQQATALWPQLACLGLGAAGASCDLRSSAGPPAGGFRNFVALVQAGSGNFIATVQAGGTGNQIQASQTGDNNTLYADQLGSDNLLGVRLVGNDNTLHSSQHGSGNQYLFSFEGNSLNHNLLQEGDNLRAVQIGVGTLPFSIEQLGHDMEIRIVHDPLSGWPR